MSRAAFGLVLVAMLVAVSCRSTQENRTFRDQPEAPVKPTVLRYVNTDGFDVMFEASLVNRDPVIIVRTENEKPDWEGRLNGWIAAWNKGGKIERRTVRGQIPRPSIDADTLREFRLLVFGVVEHAEELAKAGCSWWHEERTLARRVNLLRPYSLHFHIGDDNHIQLIFFNGDYAEQYQKFMTSLTGTEENAWSRTVACSACKKFHEASQTRRMRGTGE